jgi:integrase
MTASSLPRKSRPSPKVKWLKTSIQHLLKNRASGRYYGRFTIAGKQKWVCLKTNDYNTAQRSLVVERRKVENQRGQPQGQFHANSQLKMGDLMLEYEKMVAEHAELKPASKDARLKGLKALKKTWKGIEKLAPSAITKDQVWKWANALKKTGTGFVAPGAKRALPGNSSTTVNRTVDALRRILDEAEEKQLVETNLARAHFGRGPLRKKIAKKKVKVPTQEALSQLFDAIEENAVIGGWGLEAADFCRFLLFTGARVGEAAKVRWKDWKKEERLFHLPGYKTETSPRDIPLFQNLDALMKKIEQSRLNAGRYLPDKVSKTDPEDLVFKISGCQRSIDRFCKLPDGQSEPTDGDSRRTQVPRFTHHDLRHFFATYCIEAGVEIPILAGWLGHADGGTLLLKTYGHMRREFSDKEGLKVQFFAPKPASS